MLDAELGVEPGQELRLVYLDAVATTVERSESRPATSFRHLGDAWVSSFIGRAAELDRVAEALRETPCVTVAGPGGVGKSRLVDAFLRGRSDHGPPVAVVELTRLGSEGGVADEIADHLGLSATGPATLDAICADLASSTLLLVLDNAEHVLDQVRTCVNTLIERCTAVQVLVTSRRHLDAPGETVVTLEPLRFPNVTGAALFLDRARAASPSVVLRAKLSAPGTVDRSARRSSSVPLTLEDHHCTRSILDPG